MPMVAAPKARLLVSVVVLRPFDGMPSGDHARVIANVSVIYRGSELAGGTFYEQRLIIAVPTISGVRD